MGMKILKNFINHWFYGRDFKQAKK
jgi:hypothetical protein